MKIIRRSKTIGLLLIAFFLLYGIQQQTKGMEKKLEPDQVVIVLNDGKKIIVESGLLRYLEKIKNVLENVKTNNEKIPLNITEKQWDLIKQLLQIIHQPLPWGDKKVIETRLYESIRLLTKEELTDVLNTSLIFDIKPVFKVAVDVLAEHMINKAKDMKLALKPGQVVIVLNDGKKIIVEDDLLEYLKKYSKIIGPMLKDSSQEKVIEKYGIEIPLSTTTQEQWNTLKNIYGTTKAQLYQEMKLLELEKLVDLLNITDFLAIENILSKAIRQLAWRIYYKNLNFLYSAELQKLPYSLQYLVIKQLFQSAPPRLLIPLNHVYVPVKTLKGPVSPVSSVYSADWLPNSKYKVASGYADGTIIISDISSGNRITTLKGPKEKILSIAWAPSGKFILSCSADNTVHIWDVSSGKITKEINIQKGTISSVAWSRDGEKILLGRRSGTIVVFSINYSKDIIQKIILQDNLFISDQPIHLIDLINLELFADKKSTIAYFDGKIKIETDRNVMVEESRSRSSVIEKIVEHTGKLNAINLSLDGEYIVAGYSDGTIVISDTNNGKHIKTLKGHTASINSIHWSTDRQHIIVGHRDGTIIIWAKRDLLSIRLYTLHEIAVILKILKSKMLNLNSELKIDDKIINEQVIYDELDTETKAWIKQYLVN